MANPPYMGSNNMNKWLADWTKRAYPDSKRDLCTCFIERGQNLTIDRGYEALITSDTCMYISSFEQLRKNILSRSTIVCFIDTRGTNAHPDVFDANAGWVLHNAFAEGVKGSYFKLNQAIAAKEAGYLEALAKPDCGWLFKKPVSSFEAIPGSPLAYWSSDAEIEAFKNGIAIKDMDSPHAGISTGDNERFIKLWHEVQFADIGNKYFHHIKGGEYRKWFGNRDHVLRYDAESIAAMKKCPGFRHDGNKYYFKPMISWTKITSGAFHMRYFESGFTFDSAAPAFITMPPVDLKYILGLLNSSLSRRFFGYLNPTLNYPPGPVSLVPVIEPSDKNVVANLVNENIDLSKKDWNAYEESWGFARHPLV